MPTGTVSGLTSITMPVVASKTVNWAAASCCGVQTVSNQHVIHTADGPGSY